jgi:hypothetical protein
MTFNKTGAAKDIGFAGLFAPLNSILGLLASTPAASAGAEWALAASRFSES